jgi:hypothetical protein
MVLLWIKIIDDIDKLIEAKRLHQDAHDIGSDRVNSMLLQDCP